MTRSEAGALGIAALGHVVLFGLLSIGFLATPNPDLLKSKPIEVVIADEIALDSAAPDPSDEMPAERLAEVEGPIEPVAPPPPEPLPAPPRPEAVETPAPPRPAPAPRKPAPAAKPKPTPRPPAAAKPAPAKPKATPPRQRPATPARDRVRPTGRLSGITDGLADRPTDSNSTRQKATQSAAQARRSINVAIGQEIRPYWKPPTGADAEQLVTVVQFRLNRDGTLAGTPEVVTQRGRTDSNAPQQELHAERAIRAIRAAAPFDLPDEYYDQWKTWRLEFDARL